MSGAPLLEATRLLGYSAGATFPLWQTVEVTVI